MDRSTITADVADTTTDSRESGRRGPAADDTIVPSACDTIGELDATTPPVSGDAIDIVGVSKSFDGGLTYAIEDISLAIQPGETLVLLGSSGSGKTTLLKAINRLHEIDAGRICVSGQDVARVDLVTLRRRIGYVFQGVGLFPHQTVQANIETVPRLLGWSRQRCAERAREMLALVGLPPARFADRLPDELSGGQRQRVGVARALAADPHTVLMDEPFGALDAVVRERLQQEVRRISRELGTTVVLVTHDLFEALALADRIAVLHEGRLEQVGTPAELASEPATPFVAELLQTPARLLGRMTGRDDGERVRGSRLVSPRQASGPYCSETEGEVA